MTCFQKWGIGFSKTNSSHHASQFSVNPVHSIYNGTETSSYFGPRIWEQIPCEIRNRKFLVGFKLEIKKWKPAGCPIFSLIIQISCLLIICIHLREKNPSCFFDFGPFWRPKAQSFRISEQHPNFQFSRVMLTSLGYVVDVVLSNIKKDCWGKFEPVSTYEEITEKDW